MRYTDKTVLISGGTGTAGTAILKHLLKTTVKKIKIYSRDELKQYNLKKIYKDERIRWIIGDVRDEHRLSRACEGVDILIHTAAMKQVPACENDPIEAYKTNIGGAVSVINAALNNRIEKVVALSTDKACLDYHTPVVTENGTMKISEIVRKRYSGNVKSFDIKTGNYVWRKVIGWHKNKINGRGLYRLTSENSIKRSNSNSQSVILTHDHPVLVYRKFFDRDYEYSEVQNLDKAKKIVLNEFEPNEMQKKILYGTILGDSSINKIGERSSIRIGHSESQHEWLKIKYKALDGLHANGIRNIVGKKDNREAFYVFYLNTNTFISSLQNLFYKDNKRVIPIQLLKENMCPQLIATWYMDDGCNAGSKMMRLAMCRYNDEDVSEVSLYLNECGFINTIYYNKVNNKKYPELRFTVKGSKLLNDYISKYIPTSMRYKLIDDKNDYDEKLWDVGTANIVKSGYEIWPINKNNKAYKRDVYCIDVEDTHNFLAGNIVVHNCQPINLYGKTKSVADSLFIDANVYSWGDPKFSIVRYGNVNSSRGSVIPYYKELVANGSKTLPVTHSKMTRFHIEIEQAIALIETALTQMNGGEVFVPKIPAYSILDLVSAFGKEPEIIGIRPGEKLSEIMITEHDQTIEKINHYVIEPPFEWYDQYRSGYNISINYESETAERLTVDQLKRIISHD